jgi:Skp family chaperone for outer membrane proteins
MSSARQLERQRWQTNEVWTHRRNEALTEIVERTNRVIQEIAKSERLDLVVFADVVLRLHERISPTRSLSFRDGN